jgi:L-malate glycosyltransferase
MRPLRIGFFIQLAPRKLGSMEDWVVALVEEAARRGHRLDVFSLAPLHPTIARRIEAAGSTWEEVEPLFDHPIRSALRLAKEYNVLQLNLFAPRGSMARISYMAFPARVIFVDHHSALPSERVPTNFVRRSLDHLTTLRMSGLVGVSDYVVNRDMVRFSVGKPFARRIYNGIDLARFTPPRDCRSGPPTAIAVANLIREKGIHLLIEAFSLVDVPDARLQVVGDGPELEQLQALAQSLGVASRVEFLGLRDDVHALLQAANVFVHPCVWEEAFGLTLAEALSTGLPVIASSIGAIPEIVTDLHTGLLVPPGDIIALAGAMDRLLRDRAFRERLGKHARETAAEHFRLETSANAHIDFCEEVAGGPLGSPS